MFQSLANGLLITGAIILMGSFYPIYQMITRIPAGAARVGWYAMALITAFMMVGYLTYAIVFWDQANDWSNMIVPGLFFLVALFVWLSFSLSHQSTVDVRRVTLLERENITDPLTGLYNRRHLDRRLQEETTRSERHGEPLAIILVDLDRFKEVNDEFGHQVGDLALNHVGRVIQATLRASDVGARYGGDEFLVITPGVNATQAAVLAERLRHQVEIQPMVLGYLHGVARKVSMTISVGVAGIDEGGTTVEILFSRVDKALYWAKQAGRNRVEVYQNEVVPKR